MKDEISALLDSDLDDASSAAVVDALRRDPMSRKRWGTYCLIGDVMRGDNLGSPDFASRVMEQVRNEPTLLAPAAIDRSGSESKQSWVNLMPIAASVMGVLAVGWVAMAMFPKDDMGVSIATAVARAPGFEQAGFQNALTAPFDQTDPHRKYVFVHQAMNGGGPIPGALQYVRTVSADIAGDVRR